MPGEGERMADVRPILVHNRSELSWVVLPNKLALGSKGLAWSPFWMPVVSQV